MNLETLESRRLLSTTLTLAPPTAIWQPLTSISAVFVTPETLRNSGGITRTGTLILKGTDADDEISVVRDGNKLKYRLGANGVVNVITSAAGIKRILVEAGGGDDKVFLDPELQTRCTVLAGSGDDIVDGCFGATIVGGSGDDKLSLPPTGVFVADPNGGEVTGVWMSSVIGPGVLTGGDGDDILVASSINTVVGGRGRDTAIESIHYNAQPPTQPTVNPKEDFGDRASGIEGFSAIIRIGDSKDVITVLTLEGTSA